MGGSGRGRLPGPELGTARMLQRRIIADELALHPDVWRYLAEQAADLASEFPEGSREHLTLVLFDQASRGLADMLEQAAQVKAS
jgi:hypothetical protein